jgi:outer membrane protein assembly factor BamA
VKQSTTEPRSGPRLGGNSILEVKKSRGRETLISIRSSFRTVSIAPRFCSGVVIVLQVHELPVISEVKFEGLKCVAESVILEALRKDEIDVHEGGVYDPVTVRNAIRVIRKVLESNRQWGASVDLVR